MAGVNSYTLLLEMHRGRAVVAAHVGPAVPDLRGHSVGVGDQAVAGGLLGVQAHRFDAGAAQRHHRPDRMLAVDEPACRRVAARHAGNRRTAAGRTRPIAHPQRVLHARTRGGTGSTTSAVPCASRRTPGSCACSPRCRRSACRRTSASPSPGPARRGRSDRSPRPGGVAHPDGIDVARPSPPAIAPTFTPGNASANRRGDRWVGIVDSA